jgi:hypothetical protein
LKKLKKKKTQSRAAGKYFFFCATKKGENPCRFARLADEVMKEKNRKEKRKSGVIDGSEKRASGVINNSRSSGQTDGDDDQAKEESGSQASGSSEHVSY